MAELIKIKGTEDYMPFEQKIRQDIIRKLQQVFEKYGFLPLETPAICSFDVLASKYAGGAEILKEVYRLTDRGGRSLGLRYDLTVPFARVIGMNPEIRLPFKRYEIGKVYRDGPVKPGRMREFTQCDVDVAGIASIMAEAELLSLAVEVYGLLGLDVVISYNNRKLLSGIIQSAGVRPELSAATILALDKLEKAGAEAVRSELQQLGIGDRSAGRLLHYMEMQPEELMPGLRRQDENRLQSNALIEEGLAELDELDSYAEILGIKDFLRFSPGLARGLEIYTGTVWEVFLKDGSLMSSIGAGGRYDRIIGEFLGDGAAYPAAGMSFGLDVICEALRLKGNTFAVPPVELYIIPLGTEKLCMKLLAGLRKQGLKADMEMSGRRLKKALDFANRNGIPFVVILGEDEVKTGQLKLKNMVNGTEETIGLEKLPDRLKEVLDILFHPGV